MHLLAAVRERGEYQQDIDWVYFENGMVSPAEVESRVAKLRRDGTKFIDTVVPPTPALESPCDF